MASSNRYKKTEGKYIFRRILVAVICVCIIAGVAVLATNIFKKPNFAGGENTGNPSSASGSATEPIKSTTVKIGASGDIMVHGDQLVAAERSDGSYDFNNYFQFMKSYYEKLDLTVMNLEVSFGTSTNYRGYPTFNTPPILAQVLKNAGIDLVTTANNHTYDTGFDGLKNSIKVLKNSGLDFIGLRESTADKYYKIKEVGGIKIATANFSYSTTTASGQKALNGIVLKSEAGPLVATFDYNKLEEFYTEAKSALSEMKAAGAEYSIIYIHWGNEYQTSPNATQKKIAQKLCDMGWDIIIGSHPHVVQPIETLKRADGGETLCLYSLGNTVSNQRREELSNNGHTEDGMLFTVELEKTDGKVTLKGIELLPTWVNHDKVGSETVYRVVPLDTSIADWTTLGITRLKDAKASYNRTMQIMGSSVNAWRTAHGQSAMPTSVQ